MHLFSGKNKQNIHIKTRNRQRKCQRIGSVQRKPVSINYHYCIKTHFLLSACTVNLCPPVHHLETISMLITVVAFEHIFKGDGMGR